MIQEVWKMDSVQLDHFQKVLFQTSYQISQKTASNEYDSNTAKECYADIFNI